jgi:hypothetical protein
MSRPRSVAFFPVVATLFLFFVPDSDAVLQAQSDENRLFITSMPSGQPVYLDGLPIGDTPIEGYPVAPGRHQIHVVHPGHGEWGVKDWFQEVTTGEDTLRFDIVFTGPVTAFSEPYDAQVFLGGTPVGITPLRLTDLAPGSYTLLIRKSGFEDIHRVITVKDTATQIISVRLDPLEGSPDDVRSSLRLTGRFHRIGAYTSLGLGALFSGLALYSNHQAEQAYRRYLGTADPEQLEKAFRDAEKYDTRTSRFVVIAQINFGTSFYFFMSNVFRNEK